MVSIGDQKVSGYPAINLTNQTHQTGFLTNPRNRPKVRGGTPRSQKKSLKPDQVENLRQTWIFSDREKPGTCDSIGKISRNFDVMFLA